MAQYVETGTVLDRILRNTQHELIMRSAKCPLAEMRRRADVADPPRDMLAALSRHDQVALIAEMKRASPSRGQLVTEFDPVSIAVTYERNGAAAISVLTDRVFFGGCMSDLAAARNVVQVPVLRKDFIIDPYQLYEARAAGADAVLLIVAALRNHQLGMLHSVARTLGMAVLVEVHTERELVRALDIEPTLVGINNRDLRTFEVDIERGRRLVRSVPEGIVAVAESGMLSAEHVRQQGDTGFDAVLVGEALMTAPDIPAAVAAFSGWPRKPR